MLELLQRVAVLLSAMLERHDQGIIVLEPECVETIKEILGDVVVEVAE